MAKEVLSEVGKLFLLAALLSKDRLISNNGKIFLKELILRKDPALLQLLRQFESKESMDSSFLETVHELIQSESQRMYEELFFDTSLEVGKALSKRDRGEQELTDEKSLIYGEVDFASFYRVLRKINAQPGLIFYDLGSGTGKAVFAARLTQDFGRCVGIELLPSLHAQAQRVTARFEGAQYKELLCGGQRQDAEVHQGSFLDYDWRDGDVIFANSTCFDDDLMSRMAAQAALLSPGAIFVTFTKALPSNRFELLERRRYRMSWGPATVYIQRRIADSGPSLPPYRLNLLPSDDIEYSETDESNAVSAPSSSGNGTGVSTAGSNPRPPRPETKNSKTKKPSKKSNTLSSTGPMPQSTAGPMSLSMPSPVPPPPPAHSKQLDSPGDSALLYRKRSPR